MSNYKEIHCTPALIVSRPTRLPDLRAYYSAGARPIPFSTKQSRLTAVPGNSVMLLLFSWKYSHSAVRIWSRPGFEASRFQHIPVTFQPSIINCVRTLNSFIQPWSNISTPFHAFVMQSQPGGISVNSEFDRRRKWPWINHPTTMHRHSSNNMPFWCFCDSCIHWPWHPYTTNKANEHVFSLSLSLSARSTYNLLNRLFIPRGLFDPEEDRKHTRLTLREAGK